MREYSTSSHGLRVVALSLIVAICLSAVACGVKDKVEDNRSQVLNPPDPQIVGMQGEGGAGGFDFQVNVFCTIRNDGGAGYITVTAELNKGGYREKREVVHFAENASHKLTFNFKEPSIARGGLDAGGYVCRARSGGSPDQSGSSAAAPQRKARAKNPPTAVRQSTRRIEATNVPGKVAPGQVSGRITHMADIDAPFGRTQTITVTFENTSDVITHYKLKDFGRLSGWTITKKCRKIQGRL